MMFDRVHWACEWYHVIFLKYFLVGSLNDLLYLKIFLCIFLSFFQENLQFWKYQVFARLLECDVWLNSMSLLMLSYYFLERLSRWVADRPSIFENVQKCQIYKHATDLRKKELLLAFNIYLYSGLHDESSALISFH